MKTIRIIFVSLVMLFAVKAKAQFGMGFQFPSYGFINTQGVDEAGFNVGFSAPSSAFGLGINGYYIIKPKMRVCLSLDGLGTIKQKTSLTTVTNGQPIEIHVNVQTPLSSVHAEFQYDFVHNFVDKGFSFYGLAGFAVNSYTYTTNIGGSSLTSPFIAIELPDQTQTYTSVSLELGLGIEYAFNQTTHLFLDYRLGTGKQSTYSSVKAQSLNFLPETFSPAYTCGQLGMRFNFHSKK